MRNGITPKHPVIPSESLALSEVEWVEESLKKMTKLE